MRPATRTRIALFGLASALCAGSLAAPALGQGMGVDPRRFEAAEDVRPPDPGDPASSNTLVIYGAVIVLGGVALGLCLLPSRRGHQD